VHVLFHRRVASVKLSASRASIDALGDTVQLTTIAFDSLGTQLANQMLGYSAGDTSVVTVGASGLVTSKGNGATWIHATARNGAADSVRVVVAQQVARVVVPRDSILFEAVQAALPIRATPLDRFGSPVTAAVLTYSTQGPSIATVDTTGTIRALANGNTVVTASYGTDSVLVFVRVAQRPVRVDVSGDTVRFSALGDVQTIAAVAVDSLGSPVPHAVIGLRVPD